MEGSPPQNVVDDGGSDVAAMFGEDWDGAVKQAARHNPCDDSGRGGVPLPSYCFPHLVAAWCRDVETGLHTHRHRPPA